MKYAALILFFSIRGFGTYIPYQISSGGSLQRIESLKAANAASCVVGAVTSTGWATGANGATGNCTFTIPAGVFATAPLCQCTGTAAQYPCVVGSTSTTSVATVTFDSTTGSGSNSGSGIWLTCMGARP